MGEVATISDAQLAELAKYSKYAVKDTEMKLPSLRLNNSDKSGNLDFGKWMLGRKLNDDGTTERGQHAIGLIVFRVYYQFSYMSKNKQAKLKNCWSQMYDGYPPSTLFGGANGVRCNQCPLRAKDRDSRDKCRCQTVVFGAAILESGDQIPCACYIAGTSFMPFQKYMKQSCNVVGDNGKFSKVPPFSFVTRLGVEGPVRNDAVTYYIGAFQKGKLTDMADWADYASKCDEIDAHVEQKNSEHGQKKDSGSDNTVTEKPVYDGNSLPEPFGQPNNSGFPDAVEDIDDCPFDVAPVEPVVVGAGAKSNTVDMDEMEAMFADAGI